LPFIVDADSLVTNEFECIVPHVTISMYICYQYLS